MESGYISMAKYKKNAIKKRHILKLLMSVLFIIIVLGVTAIIYLVANNNISKFLIDESAKNVSNDEAKSATPIIVNNLLLGGVYNNKFVSIDKYFFNSTNKDGTKIDLYSNRGRIGEYEITSIKKDNSSSTVYVTNSKDNLINEYFGVISSNKINYKELNETTVVNEDISRVKNSLGLYSILNTSITISKVYETSIMTGNKVRIILATNEPNKSFGAYSAIVIYDELTNKSQCIKYNYVSNKKDASDFGIISLKFVADLNNDGIDEIIIQETKEFEVIYSIFTNKNGNYFQVLSSSMKI